MASGRKPVIYWDTSVLLAWIKDEVRPGREMEGVADVANSIFKGHYTLMTSVMTLTEVLDSSLTTEAKDKFQAIFKRRNCQLVATDHRISALSSSLRDYYQIQKLIDGLPSLGSPDAIHLATAIHNSVVAFHTFDERDQPKKRRGLIPLSGNVAGKYNLLICKPPPPPLPEPPGDGRSLQLFPPP